MIRVEHISKKLGKRQVLKDAGFEAAPGQCIGIIGANGSGKSTLLSIITGVAKPDSGNISFWNKDPLKDTKLFSKMIGYVPQGSALIGDISVKDNLGLWSKKKLAENRELIEEFELGSFLNKKVSKLSGGMRRRADIACAASNDQPVLVMDEPCASLDIFQKKKIHEFLKGFLKRNGIVIMSTHDRDEIDMCDRLFFIEGGVQKEISKDCDINSLFK
ncbi:MAG: ABC transporter ATP-binding protein [Lachnospiraceae bacterium]|nr:ABC transporter ATP-binding protein [Lachnospiraceae bacterium]